MEPKTVEILAEYTPYTKGRLIALYGCGYDTLRHYMVDTELPLVGLKVPKGPNGTFIDFNQVLMVHFAWFGISKLNINYDIYRDRVVKKGKALRLQDVFFKMTGCGSLKLALQEFWLPQTTHPGQRMVMQCLIDYIEEKGEHPNAKYPRTSDPTGTRTGPN